MSNITLSSNASGTGTFTIASPNSNTDRTLTLPDAAGTVMLTDTLATQAQLATALNASGSAPLYACRAWVNFNGVGTVAIRAAGNVTSITDNGVGNYTVNFTTAMPNTNYALIANSGDFASGTAYLYAQERMGTRSISSVAVATGYVNSGAAAIQDNANCFVAIFC